MKNKLFVKLLILLTIFLSGCTFLNIKKDNIVDVVEEEYVVYHFRNEELLESHFEKHGIEMGFNDKEEYESAANDVINNENSLHKLEKEDNDDVYYLEETKEFVVLSTDGYIRTYFLASKNYFDKQ